MRETDICIHSDVAGGMLVVDTAEAVCEIPVVKEVPCGLFKTARLENGGCRFLLDASGLTAWSPDHPVLYTLVLGGIEIRFGYTELKACGNTALLLNGTPFYGRGYIRGITAHDHPNMTGKSLFDAAVKNIRQAKKYGFNLVRFHSTIPTEEFVRAADENGMLIHVEIGYAYEMGADGQKRGLAMDNQVWYDTLLKYRNHPSIAIFCIGNELHKSGHYEQVRKLVAEGRALAPGKLIMDNSGWGEFDRQTADVYAQHIAYFFPYKHHGDMFHKEDPWLINGTASDEPLDADIAVGTTTGTVHRAVVPQRPVIAHEAVHYIDIPDYDALNRKFDAFCAAVGPEYLVANGIKKPRFMTELPKLIERKGLTADMPDYVKASRQFRQSCIKTYLEACRASGAVCGFEMLQLSDCLKYENKNGILDCFDDDKDIAPEWMRQFNGNSAILADFPDRVFTYGQVIECALSISDFEEHPVVTGGRLKVTLLRSGAAEVLYDGGNVSLTSGLQPIAKLRFAVQGKDAVRAVVRAEFTSEALALTNEWPIWIYPTALFNSQPALRLKEGWLNSFLWNQGNPENKNAVMTDVFDDQVFDDLAAGRHVILLYDGRTKGQKYLLPGTLERFKPCIWDRGSNLGGIVFEETMQKALATERYFDLNWHGLLENAWKVNLDHFPGAVREFVRGIDKPVRDRMKGLVQGVKDFIDDDTLRRFSHLFSVKLGAGTLTVCTLNVADRSNPVVTTMLAMLCNDQNWLKTDIAIAPEAFRAFVEKTTADGPGKEDVMNHFWEIDNKLVEDTLFWEEAGLDLTKIQ